MVRLCIGNRHSLHYYGHAVSLLLWTRSGGNKGKFWPDGEHVGPVCGIGVDPVCALF